MLGTYREAAERLGLLLSPADAGPRTVEIELSGERQGVSVRVRRALGESSTETIAFISPALDLGLAIRNAGRTSSRAPAEAKLVGTFFGRHDLSPADRELEGALEAFGDEPARVRTVVEGLRGELLSLVRAGTTFVVTDAAVRVERVFRGAMSSVAELVESVELATAVARAVEGLRTALPPAAAVAMHAGSFSTFASARSLSLSTTPLSVRGAIGARAFWALAVRTGRHAFMLRALLGATARASAPAPSDAIQSALCTLTARVARVELDEEGLFFEKPLGQDDCELDEDVEAAERALGAIEKLSTTLSAYRS